MTSKSHWMTEFFLDEIELILQRYDRSLILNMDEMNVGQTDSHVDVIGKKNVVGRKVQSAYNAKTLLTTCLTIAADGTRLPPLYLKKGKTARCLRSLQVAATVEKGNTPFTRFIFTSDVLSRRFRFIYPCCSFTRVAVLIRVCTAYHTDNGWSTTLAMLYYLEKVVVEYTKKQPCVLIWDVYKSHQTQEVQCKPTQCSTLCRWLSQSVCCSASVYTVLMLPTC